MLGRNQIEEFIVKCPRTFNIKAKKLRILNIGNIPTLQLASKRRNHLEDINVSKAAKVFMGFSSSDPKLSIKIILKKKIEIFSFENEAAMDSCRVCIDEMLKLHHMQRESGISLTYPIRQAESYGSNYSDYENESDIPIYNSDNANSQDYGFSLPSIPSFTIERKSKDNNVHNNDICPSYLPIIPNNSDSGMIDDETNLVYEQFKEDNNINVVSLEENDSFGSYATMKNPNSPPDTLMDLPELSDKPDFIIPRNRVVSNPETTNSHIFQADYDVPRFNIMTRPLENELENLPILNRPRRSFSCDPMVYFVSRIRDEISHPGGVKITLPNDIIDQFVVVFVDHGLWVSEIRDSVKLQGKLHVGDRIVLVDGKPVNDLFLYQQLTKSKENYCLIIQRLPKAKAFVIDKTPSTEKLIKVKEKKFFYQYSQKGKTSSWQITELNRENTFNLSDINQISNINSKIISNIPYLAIIIHSETFLKSLKKASKPKLL